MDDILKFDGDNRWLSNFWPCWVSLDGMDFPSVEHAYVAAKTEECEIRRVIQSLPTAGACKRMGKTLTLRRGWDQIKLPIMDDLLRQKFRPGTDLAHRLEATGDRQIVEGNTWGDTFWGVCEGKGSNHLGKLIMQIRAENRRGQPQ